MKRKESLLVLSILFVVIIIIITFSTTYAYLSVGSKQAGTNSFSTCFSTYYQTTSDINLVSYPMSTENAMKLTPHTFTIKNNCSISSNYKVILNVKDTSSPNIINYISYSLDGINDYGLITESTITLPSGVSSSGIMKSYLLDTGTLGSNGKSKTYNLRMWITEYGGNSLMGLKFEAQVVVYNEAKPNDTLVYDYPYTGNIQTFSAPKAGYYQLETWGAQGGNSMANGEFGALGGYGGYSTGVVYLNKNESLYIAVGGKGQDGILKANAVGGYNGGGNATWDNADDESAGAGGGATHIAKVTGLLSQLSNQKTNVLIVSGGGGGGSWSLKGGSGGGISGNAGDNQSGSGGTQTSGYLFGQGENGSGVGDSNGVAGAGAGYFGGKTSPNGSSNAAGGGSGYINSSSLISYGSITKKMYCYQCSTSSSAGTLTSSTTNTSESPKSNYVKIGDGHARITFVG